jgi:uncharacterized membrane protein YraQ (UPF0718 family)
MFKKEIKIILLSLIIFISFGLFLSFSTSAQAQQKPVNTEINAVGEKGIMSGIKKSCLDFGQCEFQDVLQIIANVFKLLRSLAFYVAIGFAIFGGIKMIISQGNSKGLESAKKTLTSALIGVLIAYGASFIVNIVITLLLGYSLSYEAIINANWLK